MFELKLSQQSHSDVGQNEQAKIEKMDGWSLITTLEWFVVGVKTY